MRLPEARLARVVVFSAIVGGLLTPSLRANGLQDNPHQYLTERHIETVIDGEQHKQFISYKSHFGEAVAFGDFDGDGCEDLAIGVPDDAPEESPIACAWIPMVYGLSFSIGCDDGYVAIAYGLGDECATRNPRYQYVGQDGIERELTFSNTGDPDLWDSTIKDRFGAALTSGDFDNDGYDDLAIGIPKKEDVWICETWLSVFDLFGCNTGRVAVVFGSSSGLALETTISVDNLHDTPHDFFGEVLAAGDFNGDDYDDIAVGIPQYDDDRLAFPFEQNRGAVAVFYGYGDPIGRGFVQGDWRDWITQEGLGLGSNENGDHFGESLAVGDFDNDGKDDLAIGTPKEGLGRGWAAIVYGSTDRWDWGRNLALNQESLGVGANEADDHFGAALAAGDFDGDGFADVAIGVPDEDTGECGLFGWFECNDAGSVVVAYGPSFERATFFNQENVPGSTAESNDHFGQALASGDFDADGFDDLAVGAPQEDFHGWDDLGMVSVFYGDDSGLNGGRLAEASLWTWGYDNPNFWHYEDAHFGSSLATGDFTGDGIDDLAIGIPDEAVKPLKWGQQENCAFSLSNCTQAGSILVLMGSNHVSGQRPTADAGPDQAIECDGDLQAFVLLDGSGSTDPDSTTGTNDDIASYQWSEGEDRLATTAQVSLPMGLGEHEVRLLVEDAAGNPDDDYCIVTVQDTQRPEFIDRPEDSMIECDAIPDRPPLDATDACDPEPVVSYSEERTDGTCPHSFTLTRSWTVGDIAGNTQSHQQLVSVQDTTTPMFDVVPAEVSFECNVAGGIPAAEPGVQDWLGSAASSDNCGQTTLTHDAPAFFALGTTDVSFTAGDECDNATTQAVSMTVRDTIAPQGWVTGPAPGSCHGPAGSPVMVTDNFGDICDAELSRQYEPGPGPTYSVHGDYVVRLTARDDAGNSAEDTRAFTVDLVPPTVVFSPRPEHPALPSTSPFAEMFSATDADGATGGVVHEVVKLNGCTIYDGNIYGNGDGLLSDETRLSSIAELCRIADLCGFTSLNRPETRIEATDCGGNVGYATRTRRGGFRVLCDQQGGGVLP